MDDVKQVMVVSGVNLDEHIEASRRVVAFHYLRNLTQFVHHVIKLGGVLQIESDVCAGLVSHFLRVDNESRSLQNAEIGELLYALMYSGSADIA